MRGVAEIGDLVAHAGLELEGAAVAQFGVELTFQDVENMTAVTPVISNIVRSVLRKCIITLPRPIPGRRLMKPGRWPDQWHCCSNLGKAQQTPLNGSLKPQDRRAD